MPETRQTLAQEVMAKQMEAEDSLLKLRRARDKLSPESKKAKTADGLEEETAPATLPPVGAFLGTPFRTTRQTEGNVEELAAGVRDIMAVWEKRR